MGEIAVGGMVGMIGGAGMIIARGMNDRLKVISDGGCLTRSRGSMVAGDDLLCVHFEVLLCTDGFVCVIVSGLDIIYFDAIIKLVHRDNFLNWRIPDARPLRKPNTWG